MPPRDVASVVYVWDDQGARADPRAARIERIRAVDRATFDAWLRNAVGGRMLVSLTGDRTRLDDARLGKLAPLTWVPVAQLYGY